MADHSWGVGLLALSGALYYYITRTKGICTIDEAKRRRNEIINYVALTLIAGVLGYVFFLYVVVHYLGVWLALWAAYLYRAGGLALGGLIGRVQPDVGASPDATASESVTPMPSETAPPTASPSPTARPTPSPTPTAAPPTPSPVPTVAPSTPIPTASDDDEVETPEPSESDDDSSGSGSGSDD